MNMQQIRETTAVVRRAGSRLWERTRVGAAVFGYMMLGLSPAMADDIDIYTKNVATGGGGAPAILFQIDNSGSMMWKLKPEYSGDTNLSTTTSKLLNQRLYRMADVAMGQATGMNNRFKLGVTVYASSSSGKLVIPVRELATPMPSAPAGGGTSTFYVEDENNDARQVQYGTLSLGGETLEIGLASTSSGWAASGLTLPESASPYTSGWPSTGYTDIEVEAPTGSAGTNTGLMAGISGNVVLWYYQGASTKIQSFVVSGATQNSYLAITTSSGSVVRTTTSTNTSGGTSSDCSGVTGNNTCISQSLTKNTWYRIVIGTDTAGQTGTFKLHLGYPEYAAGLYREVRPPQLPQRVGLNFARVDLPRDATITSAYLEFKSAASQSGTARLRAGVDLDTTPAPLSSGLFDRNVSWTTSAATDAWSSGEMGSETRIDVTSQLQTYVNQSSWCGGDTVFLVDGVPVNGVASRRDAQAYDRRFGDDTAEPAKLVVTWTGGTAGDCTEREVVLKVENSSDDVQQTSAGAIEFDNAYLSIASNQPVGLRFPLSPLPQGVKISAAYLELTSYATATAQTINIRAVDQLVASPFAGDTNALDSLTFVADEVDPGTDRVVSWTPPAWTAGTTYTSGDISTLLQPIVDNPDWQYDGGISLVLNGATTTAIRARAWERHVSGDSSSSKDRTDYGQFAARLILKLEDDEHIPVVKTHRYLTSAAVNGIAADYNTPIMGTYIESAKYMLGWDPYDDADDERPALAAGECSTNGIVILTDGEETGSYGATQANGAKSISGKTCDTSKPWNCTYDMMSAMYNKRNAALDGKKYSIRTDAIGFGPEAGKSAGLGGTDGKGGGNYYAATDAAVLVKAFREIVSNMSVSAGSVAAPGVAVNALNKFEHLDELYYALFKPLTTIGWTGNLKRYRLKDGVIVDVQGNPAISTTTGLFAETTQSWWSDIIDDGVATLGGAGGELTDPSTRKMYTYLGNYGTSMNVDLSPATGVDRDGIGAEIVHKDNPYLTSAMLGVSTTADRAKVLDYIRGISGGVPRLVYGAAVHSAPSLVTYGTDGTNGINTLFVSDNEGVLHMIDTGEVSSDSPSINLSNAGGRELFSFVTRESLPTIVNLSSNTKTVADNPYIYGLDGTWVPWKYDVDLDGTVEPADGDKVYIYGGMRRGGKNYYALDVTTVRRDQTPAPVLKWVVEGGKTGTPYANMGQSWAEPSPRWIRWNGVRRRVVFLTGGYDPAFHDNKPEFTNTDQLGRQVYMVDAETGQLLWWASSQSTASTVVPAMRYSITAAPVTLDRNGNGSVDGFYVVDLAGQVFRFDLDEGATSASNFVRGNAATVLAKLGATAPAATAIADNRRFYDAPAVAFVRSGSGGDLMLAMTSGYRESPGSTVTNEKLIFIRDVGAWNMVPPPRATALTLADLAELPATGELSAASQALPGWHMDLEQSVGEKGMGSPVFFNFALLFSTYVPKGVITDLDCAPDIGYSRLYAMNALTGAGIVNDELDNASENQRYIDQAMPGLGSTVQMLYMDGQLTILSGTLAIATDNSTGTGLEDDSSDLLDPAIFGNVRRTQWFEINQ